MRKNGWVRYEITASGGVNEYGEPIQAETTWSEPIGCSIKTNSDTRKGRYEDGFFRQASFVVLIEAQCLPPDVNRVHLIRNRENLGEHDIIMVEPFLTVGRIEILV